MNEHPHDSLPAFALGALDADEASQVMQHVSICPACHDDAEAWRTVVALLPYAPPPHDPPAHVKRRLLALIATAPGAAATAPPRRGMGRHSRWLNVATALSLVLTLMLALVTLNTRDQLAENRRMMLFITAPETVRKALAPTSLAPGAHGSMYMQSGRQRAILVVGGLPRPAPGKTYQCWLASSNRPAWAVPFDVDQDGMAGLLLDSREPLSASTQITVTIEPSGGSPKPSDDVVLSASR